MIHRFVLKNLCDINIIEFGIPSGGNHTEAPSERLGLFAFLSMWYNKYSYTNEESTMSLYETKLIILAARLENMSITERVEYCNSIGAYYPVINYQIRQFLNIELTEF